MNSRYVVLSYDNDQQQMFWDPVIAVSRDKAGEFIADQRPYASVVETLTVTALQSLAIDFTIMPEEEVNGCMKWLVNGKLARAQRGPPVGFMGTRQSSRSQEQ